MAKVVSDDRIYVAKESFTREFEGAPHNFQAGVTRVRAGHPILRGIEHLFEPVAAHYDLLVEDASAAPGAKRGA